MSELIIPFEDTGMIYYQMENHIDLVHYCGDVFVIKWVSGLKLTFNNDKSFLISLATILELYEFSFVKTFTFWQPFMT